MAHLDPKEAFEEFKSRTLEGIREHFPVRGRLQSLELENLEVKDEGLHPDDIRSQLKARTDGNTWAVPVMGTFTLRNNETGAVIDRKKMRIADIPMMTRRYSYIVDGQEWQVDNQWQLRPGVYTQRRQTGELETHFNVPNKKSFRILFEPETKTFMMERGKSKAIPVYPIMKVLGVDDDTLERQWGKDVLEANKTARGTSGSLAKFFKADLQRAPGSPQEAEKYVFDTLMTSKLRPDTTAITLGKSFENVDGDAMTRATSKMLRVQVDEEKEDDRDSLVFKDLRSAGDYVFDKLTTWGTKIALRNKMQRKLNTSTGIRDVLKFETFNGPILQTFKGSKDAKTALARAANQINPVEMISSSMRTTIMGPGGITSGDKVKDEAKLISPSHFGFLDPIHTPEGPATGVSLHLPMGIRKRGKDPTIPVYDLKEGKVVEVTPHVFMENSVVLPDQVEWKNGKPIPRGPKVKAAKVGNEIGTVDFSSARYVLRHPSQMFDVTSNLIPFMGNTSGNRASYATHHIDQAISLKEREAPLVQVGTGATTPGVRTFEELIGKQAGHTSPVDGKVVAIKKDAVVVADKNGKHHEVQIYKNFPLNGMTSMLDSSPIVQVGQTVRSGQPVADSNYTRNGTLALGNNLTVAYIPYKGYNFEDGVVISESAAKKLSSVHMHKPAVVLDEKMVTNPRTFQFQHPQVFVKDQYKHIDDNGIARIGSVVRPGDPLVLATKPFELKDKIGRAALRKSSLGVHTDHSLRWDSDYPGEVVGVHRNKDGEVTVQVKTLEKMQVGDKISGRSGNKGIVTSVLPDDQMPRTSKGQPIEVALNPSGVPGRMSIGQVLETAAAKIAKKTGKPYVIENFGRTEDMLKKVQHDLKTHGLSDTEELFDPTTGVSLGPVLTGPQHMLKLEHQVSKKISARSGMNLPGAAPEYYDRNLMPQGGGKTGAQSMGNLGMYTLLAHGARANIREMQTWKSEGEDPAAEGKRWPSQHNDVWRAIQYGDLLPTPRPTFAFQKFTDMLRVAGINVEKQGHRLQVAPLTDKQILAMSNGELHKPDDAPVDSRAYDKDTGEPIPRKGSTFDPKVTGGHGGKRWSHFKLAEPMPNPVFESAIQKVLGLTEDQYTSLVSSEKAYDPKSKNFVGLGKPGTVTGGPAIVHMLGQIDVKKELERSKKELEAIKLTPDVAFKTGTQKIDKAVKRVKYLNALDTLGMTASEAYTLQHVPVLPPAMRPISLDTHGKAKTLHVGDLNTLYQDLAAVNEKMKHPNFRDYLGDEDKREQRVALYDGLKALMGLGTSETDRKEKKSGILSQIKGSQPKEGYFQKTLLSRRQDLTMRSTIVPEPAMGLDQVGLPTDRAFTLFRPFVVKKIVETGIAKNPLDAQKLLTDKKELKSPGVLRALDLAMAERPVLLKRDPALHKHSVMAFNAFRVPGHAVQIHPLVTGGYNADFDGDQMSVYVPIHPEAVAEARNMFPSNNLFNEATGKVMHTPTLESALGLYKLSRVTDSVGKSFNNPADALRAVESGKLRIDQLVDINGVGKTTPGRLLIASALPESMQKTMLNGHNVLDKSGLSKLYTTLAKEHRGEYGDIANRLKDLGYDAAFGAIKIPHPEHKGPNAIMAAENRKERVKFLPIGTHTLSLNDFQPDRSTRDHIVQQTQQKVDAIQRSTLPQKAKDERAIDLWLSATNKMVDTHMKKAENNQDNLYQMLKAGVKPDIRQYQQMKLAPMLLQDAAGRIVPTPVTKSYAEGLDLAGYWTQMHGARKGSVQKVQEVQEPGSFSKMLVNTTMGLLINGNDCGTSRGVHLPISSPDVYDRELASDLTFKGQKFPRGTLLSADVVGQIRTQAPDLTVPVRSPLKCEHGQGLCQKCAGLSPTGQHYQVGTNLGVLSAQSLGERAVQLTLKSFHSGGVAGSNDRVLEGFKRIQQLTNLPKTFPNSAAVAMRSGTIDKIEHERLGSNVIIDGQAHFVPRDHGGRKLTEAIPGLNDRPWSGLKIGQKIEAGSPLSDPNRTIINPRDLYRATKNIEKVQNHLVNELHGIYDQQGVRRQHIETVVKAMTNLGRVVDPGDVKGVLKGEFQPISVMRAANRELVGKGRKPAVVAPTLQGINVLPLNAQEDWMAKLNFQRLRHSMTEAVSTAAFSDLHGVHPVPGMVFGAEFGLTRKHRLRSPHLADVPEYSY